MARAVTFDRPARRARRRSSSSLRPSTSSASRRPLPPIAAAIASVLPPAPAHASATRPPGGGATSSATSWLPSSMTSNRPSRNADRPNALTRVSRTSPAGASAVGRATTFSSARRSISASREILTVFTRSAIGARWFIAAHAASPSVGPRSLTSRSTSQVGYDSRTASRSRPVRVPRPASSSATPPRSMRAPRRLPLPRPSRASSPSAASTGIPSRRSSISSLSSSRSTGDSSRRGPAANRRWHRGAGPCG